jgi:peptidoglycan/LPS O-acetylase OafA/YrhL
MKALRHEYIDALRGYAILLVMAVHASQAAGELDPVEGALINQGARGVQLFFVTSALTLVMSWHFRGDGLLRFYVRRVFRIAPMFWLGIIFFTFADGFAPRYFAPNGIDATHVAFTALFLHGWHPEYITSVVPGGWSIAVEMMFYLLFPLLIFCIRGWMSATLVLFATIIVADKTLQIFWSQRSVLWPGISDDLVSTLLNLWLPSQLPVFIVGFLVFFAIEGGSGILKPLLVRFLLLISLAAMVLLAFYNGPVRLLNINVNIYTSYALCFGLFAFCLAQGCDKYFVNAPICVLGKISFSAYLWHFVILHNLYRLGEFNPIIYMTQSRGLLFFCELFIFLVGATGLLSTITYLTVERPMIRVGNMLLSTNAKL